MHTRFSKPLAAAAVALVTTAAIAAPATAEVHLVRQGESIQAAIDVAVSGDTILILPGQYAGTLLIEGKQLTLAGISTDVTTLLLSNPLLPPGEGRLTVRGAAASGTVISGLRVRPASTSGVALVAEADVTIEDCIVDPVGGQPLLVAAGASVEVRSSRFAHTHGGIQNDGSLHLIDCQFSDCTEVLGSRASQVACPPGSTVQFERCVFADCLNVVQAGGETISMSDCVFFRCGAVLARVDCAAVDLRGGAVLDASTFAFTTRGVLHVADMLFAGSRSTVLTARSGAELQVSGCTFSDNSGQYLIDGLDAAAVSIRNSTFQANSGGGGIRIESTSGTAEITDCRFVDNSFLAGSAAMVAAQGTIARCTFERNAVGPRPGAALLAWNGSVIKCQFIENTAPALLRDGRAERCRFERNVTSDIALLRMAIDRCEIVGNTSARPLASDVDLTSSTIIGNTGQFDRIDLTGCTFVHNTGPCILRPPSGSIVRANMDPLGHPCQLASASYSNVQGALSGPGNIDADPHFVRNPSPGLDSQWGTPDDYYGDLRLRSGSPCIDAGDSTPFPIDAATDLAGQPRVVDDPATPDTGLADDVPPRPVADIGAYEFQPDAPPPCPCDFDGNGRIETADLLIYVNLWFDQAPAANLDADAAIDVRDLLAFLDCFLTPRVDPTAC